MKKILAGLAVIGLLVVQLSVRAYADDDNLQWTCAHPHPNTVACYDSGSHAIVGESQLHYGFDIVWRDGDSKNYTQIFKGQGENGTEWEKSQWIYIGHRTHCEGGILVQNAKESGWGDYFPANANYCVYNEEHVMHNDK